MQVVMVIMQVVTFSQNLSIALLNLSHLLWQAASQWFMFETAFFEHYEKQGKTSERRNLLVYKPFADNLKHLFLHYLDAKITNYCHTNAYKSVFLTTVIINTYHN